MCDGTRWWRDRELSERHMKWGETLPAVDMDFVLIEHSWGQPAAIVDYTRYDRTRPFERTNQDALGNLYRLEFPYDIDAAIGVDSFKRIPFLVVRYWPNYWAFEAEARNDEARRLLGGRSALECTEQEWVGLIRRARGFESAIPQAIASHLNEITPTEAVAAMRQASIDRALA